MTDLAGRAAIVTGGARGIGRAVCEALAAAGCGVVVNYQGSADAAAELVEQIRAGGGSAEAVAGSVADAATGERLADAALRAYGRIDVLVNNAGITRDVTARRMSDADWVEVIETNLTGAHRVTRPVLEPMCAAGYGRIVNIASFVGQIGNFGQTNYAASKAGMIGWTKALALETARTGVTVNCVCPGFIDTDMLRAVPDEIRARLLERVPVRRFGTAEDVAAAVLYLVRDGAYVTGACIDVNGGLAM
ncbi:MAG TPA: 3-oxoacyl-ACP reductase [Thermoleophilia bacterium]|nr:3-oxoacyl-ACP reductase [Thermoleophilia bacterium]